jgi:curved DNA-binding protein
MEKGHRFLDYYSILQVHPECNKRSLEMAYRHLAKIYHPDHPETADIEMFNKVIEAYRFLKNGDKRINYDAEYARNTGFSFENAEGIQSEHMAALTDATIHSKLLLYLYKKRRECARDPGVGMYDILRTLNCPEENFEFHLWYLKKKGFIETTDDGTLAITVVGVDYVISTSQNKAERRLRITQLDETEADAWPEAEFSASVG